MSSLEKVMLRGSSGGLCDSANLCLLLQTAFVTSSYIFVINFNLNQRPQLEISKIQTLQSLQQQPSCTVNYTQNKTKTHTTANAFVYS